MRFCYANRRFALFPLNKNYRNMQPEDYTNRFLKVVKKMGFDAIEVDLATLELISYSNDSIQEFAKQISEYGLSIGAVRAGGSITSGRYSRDNRARTLNAIELASSAGAEIVNGALSAPARYPGHPPGSIPASGSGWSTSQDSSRDAMLWMYDSIADFYRQAAQKASHYGVKIAIEVHQNSPVDNSWSAIKIHQMVDNKNFGINPDIGNIMWNYDVPEEDFDNAILALAPISIYWHCKNFMRVYHPENSRSVFLRVPLPDGEIDYRFAVEAMANANYSGYMAIEGAWAGDQWYADSRSTQYAKSLWENIGK